MDFFANILPPFLLHPHLNSSKQNAFAIKKKEVE